MGKIRGFSNVTARESARGWRVFTVRNNTQIIYTNTGLIVNAVLEGL